MAHTMTDELEITETHILKKPWNFYKIEDFKRRQPTPIERSCGAKWRTNYLAYFRNQIVTPYIVRRAIKLKDPFAENYCAVMQHVFHTLT